MSKLAPVLVALLIVGLSALWWSAVHKRDETVFEPPSTTIETGSPCPWRNADNDLANWFPYASRYEAHDLILSGKRLGLQQKLGRSLLPEEMSLRYYLIRGGTTNLGFVLPGRIKGPHGAIEIVTAIYPDGAIRNFKLQAIREPADLMAGLDQINLERKFLNKTVADDFQLNLPDESVATSTADCAQLIAGAVKTQIVLWDAGGQDVRHH